MSFPWRGGKPGERRVDDVLQRLAAGPTLSYHVHALHDRYQHAGRLQPGARPQFAVGPRRGPLGPRETVETGCGVLLVAASRLIPGSPM